MYKYSVSSEFLEVELKREILYSKSRTSHLQFVSKDFFEAKPLKGLRVGVIRETLDDGVDPEVISSVVVLLLIWKNWDAL